jgi:hypothetical protein
MHSAPRSKGLHYQRVPVYNTGENGVVDASYTHHPVNHRLRRVRTLIRTFNTRRIHMKSTIFILSPLNGRGWGIPAPSPIRSLILQRTVKSTNSLM